MKTTNHRKALNSLGFSLCWFAVIGQLVLIILNRQADVFETIIRFFSYFTVLTNMLVAIYFSCQILKFKTLKFLQNDSTLTAITTFILMVGLVYQFVLRSIWQPSGFQMVIDEMLHTIVPLYMLLYWFLYVNLSNLKLQNLLMWLIYPFAYFIVIMIRGHFSSFYPYPFIDVSDIGYLKVFTNFMILSMFVLMLMGSLYVLARFFKKH